MPEGDAATPGEMALVNPKLMPIDGMVGVLVGSALLSADVVETSRLMTARSLQQDSLRNQGANASDEQTFLSELRDSIHNPSSPYQLQILVPLGSNPPLDQSEIFTNDAFNATYARLQSNSDVSHIITLILTKAPESQTDRAIKHAATAAQHVYDTSANRAETLKDYTGPECMGMTVAALCLGALACRISRGLRLRRGNAKVAQMSDEIYDEVEKLLKENTPS